MVNRGIDINAKDDQGNTLLHDKYQNEPAEYIWLIRTLLAHGANINEKNNDGETPLRYREKNGASAEILQILRDHGGKTRTFFS